MGSDRSWLSGLPAWIPAELANISSEAWIDIPATGDTRTGDSMSKLATFLGIAGLCHQRARRSNADQRGSGRSIVDAGGRGLTRKDAGVIVPEAYSDALATMRNRSGRGRPGEWNSRQLRVDAGRRRRDQAGRLRRGDRRRRHNPRSNARGRFYGTRTVLQLLRQDHALPRGRLWICCNTACGCC